MKEDKNKKLGISLLVPLAIGTMIASGIFNSPIDLIETANPLAVIISWVIGVTGVIMIGIVFYMLSNKRPELKGGIYSYAKTGYGDFVGFNSAWGYWTSSLLGNMAFIFLIFKTINSLIGDNYFMPPIYSFIFGSILLWFYYFLIKRGIKEAGKLNLVITIAKIIPLILVIVLGMLVFSADIFNVPNWQTILASNGKEVTLGKQISDSMGSILWCFVGVEGLVVLSDRAKSQNAVAKSTIIALIVTAMLYMLISVISMGVLPANELLSAQTPLALVLSKTALGDAGGMIVKLGILISLLGALLCWNLITTEILYLPAKQDNLMPKWFKKVNDKNVPVNALLFSMVASQLILLGMLSPALQKGYYIVTHIATTNILIPYLLSSMFALKTFKNEKNCIKEKAVCILACIYSTYVIYAAGVAYLALAFIMYATGIGFYIKAKKEKQQSIASKEKMAMIVMVIIAIIMIIAIAMGKVSV